MKLSDADMTCRIRGALRTHFGDTRRYCFLEEVGNATGFANAGWADAVVLQLYPSDGLELWGFEIKSSRTDWLKELKNPKKAENLARYCERWIIVAPKGLVREGELPAAWGLWEYDVDKDKFVFKTAGVRKERVKYIPRLFFASLLRRTQESMPAASFVARLARAANEDAERKHAAAYKAVLARAENAEKRNSRIIEAAHSRGLRWSEYGDRFEEIPAPRVP